jgi:F-type H+/Na+-transporting ATPase subunit alpha
LTRGERLVEILKQPQYQPLPMEKQVTIIFAGGKGFLDELPVNTWLTMKRNCTLYRTNEPSIFSELKEKQEISPSLEEKMKKTLTTFGETFKATKGLN